MKDSYYSISVLSNGEFPDLRIDSKPWKKSETPREFRAIKKKKKKKIVTEKTNVKQLNNLFKGMKTIHIDSKPWRK